MQNVTPMMAVALAIATTLVLSLSPSTPAARVKSCLRVVPSGDVVMWYGSRCP